MRQDFNPEELENRMNSRGVKPTAVRLLVFAELRRSSRPLSMGIWKSACRRWISRPYSAR